MSRKDWSRGAIHFLVLKKTELMLYFLILEADGCASSGM
jgi:hypothetical protein